MRPNFSKTELLLGIGVIALGATEAVAQSRYGNPYDTTGYRFLTMSGSVVLGFALGWFSSPNGKVARNIFAILAGLALFMTGLTSGGTWGWGAVTLFSIIGFCIGLGYWLNAAVNALGETPTTFGSSRWAMPDDLAEYGVLGSKGLRLGDAFGEPISYYGDRHLLTVAPTRSGKGTTQIIPNLLTYDGSVLVIDPKGENALITAKRRKDMGQNIHIVDPWGIVNVAGVSKSTFNPLDWLDYTSSEITENAMILADALVVTENHSDAFWGEEAKALLQGILLYVASDAEEDGHRHLDRVRKILVSNTDELTEIFTKMAASAHHIIASTGNRCLQKDPKLLSNVLASAQAQTHFLDSDNLRDNMMRSSFRFEDLKSKPTTVYLVLPADRLNTFGRWLRLLIQQAITINARNIEIKPTRPVLFILDEFAALGRLSMVEQAYGLMAGFGIQLWGIVQDLNQLERIYDKGWQSFISNSGMINYFGSSDKMTAEYFSAMCGEQTVWNLSSAVSNALGTNKSPSGGSASETKTDSDTRAASQRKLIYPDELMRLKGGKQVAFVDNMHPLIADKTAWFDDDDLKGLGVNLQDKETPSALQD